MHAWVRPSPHTHTKCGTEVFSSVPHFLQVGSLHNSMICKCLLKVLCPVSRPVTTLDCILLKGNSRAPIARSGPEINSRACLCIPQGPRYRPHSGTNKALCKSLSTQGAPRVLRVIGESDSFIDNNLIHNFLYKLHKIKFLYMFQASSAHLQEVNDVNP